jgi:hypothetical protein
MERRPKSDSPLAPHSSKSGQMPRGLPWRLGHVFLAGGRSHVALFADGRAVIVSANFDSYDLELISFYNGIRRVSLVLSFSSKYTTTHAFSLVDCHDVLFLEILQSSIVLHIHGL